MDSSNSPKTEPAVIGLAIVPVLDVAIKAEDQDIPQQPQLAWAPIVYDEEAQIAALAFQPEPFEPVEPKEEEEDDDEGTQAYPDSAFIGAIAAGPKIEPESDSEEEEEPAPPGTSVRAFPAYLEGDPFGLGPRRSRSPPASRAQLRTAVQTASMRPRTPASRFEPR